MDILEKRVLNDLDREIVKLIPLLQFEDYPIEIKGSSSLKSQRYYSDYDLITNISGKFDKEEAYRHFYNILKNTLGNKDIYFIELKLQDTKGKKYRWFPDEDFDKDKFMEITKNIDFIKLDLVVRVDFRFIDLSIIYKITPDDMTKEEYIKSLEEDIKELKKEGNYYKVLKRLFSIYQLRNDTKKLLYLSEIFNSPLGEMYQKISNMEGIQRLLKEGYTDDSTITKIKINLKDIGESEDLKKLNNSLKKQKNELNKEAKKIYDKL